MPRKLVWIDQPRFRGWGCSRCTWVFNPSSPPIGEPRATRWSDHVSKSASTVTFPVASSADNACLGLSFETEIRKVDLQVRTSESHTASRTSWSIQAEAFAFSVPRSGNVIFRLPSDFGPSSTVALSIVTRLRIPHPRLRKLHYVGRNSENPLAVVP
jgi:hypothetical protein